MSGADHAPGRMRAAAHIDRSAGRWRRMLGVAALSFAAALALASALAPATVRAATAASAAFEDSTLRAVGAGPAAAPSVQVLASATLQASPEGLGAQAPRAIGLPHRWDHAWPGKGGRARYTVELPPWREPGPAALLFSRVGNQATLELNGQPVATLGSPGDDRRDAAKVPHLVTLPRALLAADAPNLLTVDAQVQASRWGGLARVRFGTPQALQPVFESQRLWRNQTMLALAIVLALAGSAAAALAWTQRLPLYAAFAAAAWAGVPKAFDRATEWTPLAWPLWGALVASTFALHLALLVKVVDLLLDDEDVGFGRPRVRWRDRLGALSAAAAATLGALALASHRPMLWTAGLALLVPYAAAVVGRTAVAAWRDRSPVAIAMFALAALATLTGLHDLVLVRAGATDGGGRMSWMPLASFAAVLAMGTIVLQRYTRAERERRALQRELGARVALREAQLKATFDALQTQAREHAVLEERQRLMREIHDGVGAQLVGLLNLAHGRSEPEALERQARLALDEMRMAVDALQPTDGDLATVLATLRWRLQPRLSAAGLAMDWQVPTLPTTQNLTPAVVMQVQRVLLQAFTNALQHAGATRLTVRAGVADDAAGVATVWVELCDDGVGFDPAETRSGQGLANMRARATQIGATLEIAAATPRGTRIRLSIPLASPPGRDG